MALTPKNEAENNAFLREVDEAMRREQVENLFTKQGKWVALALILFLTVVGGYLYWGHSSRSADEATAEKLVAVLQDIEAGKLTDIDKRLAEIRDSGSPGYKAAALFQMAGLQMDKKDLAGAAKTYASIANDTSMAQPYRDFALVKQTIAEFETLKPQQVIDRLSPLAKKGNPWFGSAGELVGISYMRINQPQKAGALFAEIAADKDAPPSIRSRLTTLAGSLGVDAVTQNDGEAK